MADMRLPTNATQDAQATQRVQELLECGHTLGFAIDSNFYITSGGGSLKVPFRSKLAGCNGRFQHLCPSVWEREIKKHLREGVDKAKDKAKSVSIGNIAILDSPEAFSAIKSLQEAADKIDSQTKASSLWDIFAAETHIIPVNVPVDSANTVLDWYFEQRLPFEGSGDKKNEFPDAFALHSLSRYADENGLKVVVVITKDKGAYGHCQSDANLLPFRDVQSALGAFDTKELIERRRKLSEIASKSMKDGLLTKLKAQLMDFVNLPYQHQNPAWGALTKPNFPQNPRIMIDELIKFDLIPSGNFGLPIIITGISEYNHCETESEVNFSFRVKANIQAKASCEISAIDNDNPGNQKLRQSFLIDNPVEAEGYLNFSICVSNPTNASAESILEAYNCEHINFDFFSAEMDPIHVNVPDNFEYRGFA